MNELNRYNLLRSEINGIFHETSMRMGLADSVSIILYTLCDAGGAYPLTELVRSSGISKQTINSALRKMEAGGLVTLGAIDSRKKMICLTEAGKALAGRTVSKMLEKENEIFASWTEAERELYLGLTQRYLTQIRDKFKEII